jgi:hypothetical protein
VMIAAANINCGYWLLYAWTNICGTISHSHILS